MLCRCLLERSSHAPQWYELFRLTQPYVAFVNFSVLICLIVIICFNKCELSISSYCDSFADVGSQRLRCGDLGRVSAVG